MAGENAFIIYFTLAASVNNEKKNADIIRYVASISHKVQLKLANIVLNVIPAYHSLLIVFDTDKSSFNQCQSLVENLMLNSNQQLYSVNSLSTKTLTLPIYYDESVGPDLARIAKHAKLTVAEVINLHQQGTYYVNAIGFAPGFAYLGEVNSKIAMPRLTSPRLSVPKGAVAIAEQQTAIYPASSPGGWNIIGRCPLTLFDINKEQPMSFSLGDTVTFDSVDKNTFLSLGGEL
ncbi:5-oxoprolinase subunit PxpB [Thalassotalea piscium]|uniref:5-oxoprolinase subunit PxpB n=1 Tax=Thalassotalea piscium TaxID=1230533 RepID=UPI002572EBBA|nr:5-oxoprolinase subunit PxpB [Thalassotalea piscium]